MLQKSSSHSTSFRCDVALEIPMQLVHAFKSGKICLLTSGKGTLQLRIEDETIAVNLLNKKLPKNLLETIVVPEEKAS